MAVGIFQIIAAGSYTVFDDEALSCRLYTLPAGQMLAALWHGEDPDPPLYYLLINGWVRLFGVGPLGMRSLSILLFLAGVMVLRRAAETWFGPRVGRAAMILAALHPAHLLFGMAARWYALALLLTALLLHFTGIIHRGGLRSRHSLIGWTLAAAALMYTNYFGAVIVALSWLIVAWGLRRGPMAGSDCGGADALRGWIEAAVTVAVLYAPWWRPFLRQLTAFDGAAAGWHGAAASAARTGMALLAGNLAGPGAWWVWVPGAVFSLGIILLLAQRRETWPQALLTLGIFALGVGSGVLIDKYVLLVSGPACVLAAALMIAQTASSPPPSPFEGGGVDVRGRRVRAATLAGLAAAWLGCAVNLVTGEHWSSLRWHDPFERVIEEWMPDRPRGTWVLTHPSARYYYARKIIREQTAGDGLFEGLDPDVWRRVAWSEAASTSTTADSGDPQELTTPAALLARPVEEWPAELWSLRTAGFAGPDDWQRLLSILEKEYALVRTSGYDLDPLAEWKDRVDPRFVHPAFRITVQHWLRKARPL